MKCPNCGGSLSENDIQCPYCDTFFDTYDDDYQLGFKIQKVNPEDDKINILILLISIITPVGLTVAVVYYLIGYVKCAKASLIAAFIPMFLVIFGAVIFSLVELIKAV
ncbi:hypothetical protein [Ruminococcus sp.]|uniref:hypothetical protein n=1 Tax=Ruminococcus sp. TaxID=41978 RepID=UPI0025F6DEB0|nr:hypothetical protein [Ruminococcus sp.]